MAKAPPVDWAVPEGLGLLLVREASGAAIVELAGGTEKDILLGDELGVLGHKDLAGVAQVELLGMVAEELAVDAAPDETAVGVDIDLGDTEFGGLEEVLAEEGVQIRLFGKPEVHGHRRMGVILATDKTIELALAKAERAYSKLTISL